MARANIEVTLQGGEAIGTVKRYAPGEVLRGEVLAVPDSNLKSRRLVARLQWRTEGRGDVDRKVIEEMVLMEGPMQAGMPYQYSFQFTLPNEPWSYAGHYISIVWEVEASIDIPFARDPKGSQSFILSPLAEKSDIW